MTETKNPTPSAFWTIRSHMGPEVRRCERKYSEIIWERDEMHKWFYRFGEAKICGARVFQSPTSGRDLPCGGCEIRKGALVLEAKKMLWALSGNPENPVRELNRKIDLFCQMTSCNFQEVMTEARREFEIEYAKFREERERKKKERERVLEERQKQKEAEKEFLRMKA